MTMQPIEFAVRQVTFVFPDGSRVTDSMPCALVPLDGIPENQHDAIICAVGRKLLDTLAPSEARANAEGSD